MTMMLILLLMMIMMTIIVIVVVIIIIITTMIIIIKRDAISTALFHVRHAQPLGTNTHVKHTLGPRTKRMYDFFFQCFFPSNSSHGYCRHYHRFKLSLKYHAFINI